MFNDRVLVVENDRVVIDAITGALGAEGYDITVAGSVREGLELYRRLAPEVVIIDLWALKDNIFFEQSDVAALESCSLIAMTSESGMTQDSFSRGISASLRKPLNVHEVRAVVRNTMALKRLQKELQKEIDGRKRSEHALCELRQHHGVCLDTIRDMQTIFDNIPLGVAYLDKDFRFLKINAFLERMLKAKSADIEGKTCYDTVGEFAKNAAKTGLERICSFCKKDECFTNKTQTVIERHMGDMVLRVKTIPEIDADGNIYRFLEIVEDITMPRYTEDKMVRTYQIQSVVGAILQISLEPVSLTEQLQRILDLIFSIPSLSLKSKGAIFITRPGTNELAIKAARGFNPAQTEACSVVPFGTCLCGLAAQT
ncbi:signal transduction histidine kinase, partial [Candidatus Magnetobacterium bavaricum]